MKNPKRRDRISARRAKRSRAIVAVLDSAPLAVSSQPLAPVPRYRVALYRIKGCYVARVLDIPGCVSRGASEVEAVENARMAIRAYLGIARALAGDRAVVELEICA